MSYATVGMMYPVFAPLVSHTPGGMPSYGTGRVLQEARELNVSKTYNTNPLWGDDREVDNDNGLTSISYDFENTGLNDLDKQKLLGEETNANTLTGGQWESDADTPYGGFAHIERSAKRTARRSMTHTWHSRSSSRKPATRPGRRKATRSTGAFRG